MIFSSHIITNLKVTLMYKKPVHVINSLSVRHLQMTIGIIKDTIGDLSSIYVPDVSLFHSLNQAIRNLETTIRDLKGED